MDMKKQAQLAFEATAEPYRLIDTSKPLNAQLRRGCIVACTDEHGTAHIGPLVAAYDHRSAFVPQAVVLSVNVAGIERNVTVKHPKYLRHINTNIASWRALTIVRHHRKGTIYRVTGFYNERSSDRSRFPVMVSFHEHTEAPCVRDKPWCKTLLRFQASMLTKDD